jgi:8-oxo-dGTP pyrophosphatase MutT (NUDIX family)
MEEVIARGKLFELVQIHQPDGRVFEVARRAPGVRLIIANKDAGTVLLTKEYRHELNDWDYRLPGGKVFDSLDEYEAHRSGDNDMLQAATTKARGEGAEEAGIEVIDLTLFKKSTLGATVEWDLFVFEVTEWKQHEMGQQLETGEQIEADNWFTYKEVEQMIVSGKMQEERIALILLQWLKKRA